MKKIKFLSLFIILILGCIAIGSLLLKFGTIDTTLNLKQSVTVNDKDHNEKIVYVINGSSGNVYYKSIVIKNNCNRSINITCTHTYIEGIDVYITYNNMTIDFPTTLNPNSIYNGKIVYDTSPYLKPKKYKITTEFSFLPD